MQQPLLIVRQLGLRPGNLSLLLCTSLPIDATPIRLTSSGWWSTIRFYSGRAGKAEHLLMPGDIPVVQSDRGGQVTYHGPGQQVMYVLIDLKRRKLGVRQLVTAIEQTVVDTLAHYDVEAYARPDAPGVYVAGKKFVRLAYASVRGVHFTARH